MLRLGIVTGISYVSGIQYYKDINQRYAQAVGAKHVMPPNPHIVIVSVDCDQYAHMLINKDWNGVQQYLISQGVDLLVAADCNFICLASNTAHIAYPAIRSRYPDINILHIADCTAQAVLSQGIRVVGLLGTEMTMCEDYLKDRLALHGIEVLVPEEESSLAQLFQHIMHELGFGIFKSETKQFFLTEIRKLKSRGAGGLILGCTEIELLITENRVCGIPVFPSAQLHIECISAVLSGNLSLESLQPRTPGRL